MEEGDGSNANDEGVEIPVTTEIIKNNTTFSVAVLGGVVNVKICGKSMSKFLVDHHRLIDIIFEGFTSPERLASKEQWKEYFSKYETLKKMLEYKGTYFYLFI